MVQQELTQQKQCLHCVESYIIAMAKRPRDPSKYYDGKPCKNCGTTLKLKADRGCISCKNDRSRQRTEGNRERAKQWYQDNRDRAKQVKAAWAKANPEITRQASKRSIHKRRAVATIRYTSDQLNQRIAVFGNQCVYCLSCDNITLDHFLSLNNGGINALKNLVPCCKPCNSSKCDRDPIEWMKQRGLSEAYINALVELILELAS